METMSRLEAIFSRHNNATTRHVARRRCRALGLRDTSFARGNYRDDGDLLVPRSYRASHRKNRVEEKAYQ